MALRPFSAGGLAAVLAGGLLASGCTPDPGSTPPPMMSPTPSVTASPTPTRSETTQEREQRIAFEAAEKAYRVSWTEYGRLAVDGGAEDPTQKLLDTSTGKYLSATMESLRSIKKQKLQISSPGSLEWVRPKAYGEGEVILEGCEDYRSAILTKPNGETLTPSGTRVYQQTITAQRVSDRWKLSAQVTSEVDQC